MFPPSFNRRFTGLARHTGTGNLLPSQMFEHCPVTLLEGDIPWNPVDKISRSLVYHPLMRMRMKMATRFPTTCWLLFLASLTALNPSLQAHEAVHRRTMGSLAHLEITPEALEMEWFIHHEDFDVVLDHTFTETTLESRLYALSVVQDQAATAIRNRVRVETPEGAPAPQITSFEYHAPAYVRIALKFPWIGGSIPPSFAFEYLYPNNETGSDRLALTLKDPDGEIQSFYLRHLVKKLDWSPVATQTQTINALTPHPVPRLFLQIFLFTLIAFGLSIYEWSGKEEPHA